MNIKRVGREFKGIGESEYINFCGEKDQFRHKVNGKASRLRPYRRKHLM